MDRDLSHWLIEDDNQGDYPLPEDSDCSEPKPKEYEPHDDENSYEVLVP